MFGTSSALLKIPRKSGLFFSKKIVDEFGLPESSLEMPGRRRTDSIFVVFVVGVGRGG